MTTKCLEDILDRCLARLAAGEELSACLRDEPQHAQALAPLLRVAVALRSLALPQPEGKRPEVWRRHFYGKITS